MTVITLPPNDVLRVRTFTDLPAQSIDGLLGVVKDVDALYVYDQGTSTWILISSSIFVSTVTDTDSIDLTVTLGNLSADLRLSSNAADAGSTLVSLDIESTGVKGLRAQITNSSVRGLLSATAPVTYNNTTGVIAMPVSTNAVDGYLSAADHTTFAAKVGPTRAVNTTAPLAGGGALSADLTLSIPAATTVVDGYLSAANFVIFNNKVGTARAINTTAPLTGGGDLSADRTIAIPAATTVVDGYLSAANFVIFNNKVGTARLINTTAPLTGGGDLSADRTLSMPAAATAQNGYLTSTDWNTFNGKQAAITVGALGAGNASGLSLTAGSLVLHAATATQPGALTVTTQTIVGDKTFNDNIIKPTVSALNTSFRSMATPETTFQSVTTLQTCSATFGNTGPLLGHLFAVTSTATNSGALLFASYATATISAISDPSNMFLSADAGTGIYISKSASSNVISFKNRTGGTTTIGVVSVFSTVTSIGAWA